MSVDQPQIDFVIPAYNAQETILRTISSLQAQSDPRWVAIVVDDGSTDSTVQIVEEINDPRVQVHSQLNAGPSAARNYGYGIDASPLVCFLDADDTVHRDFVKRMAPIALGAVLGASCGYDYKGVQGDTLCTVPPMGRHRFERPNMLGLDPPAIMSTVYKRSVLDELMNTGPIFDESMRAYEDWDMLDRLVQREASQAELFGRCDGVLASYWCTPDSLSSSMNAVWESGCALIQSRCATKEASARSIAKWGLGLLGGCIISEDHETVAKIKRVIGPLKCSDAWALVQALRWHAMRRFGMPLSEIDSMQEQILSRCNRVLQDSSAADAIKECFASSGSLHIKHLLVRAAEMTQQGGRIVIYGLGRNGMLVVELADKLGIDFVLVDDQHDGDTADPSWIDADSIGKSDVVIVTPMESESIMRSLSRIDSDRLLSVQSAVGIAESS